MKKETTFDFLKPILLKNSIDGESLEVFNFLISYENFSKETLQSVLTPKLIWRAYNFPTYVKLGWLLKAGVNLNIPLQKLYKDHWTMQSYQVYPSVIEL